MWLVIQDMNVFPTDVIAQDPSLFPKFCQENSACALPDGDDLPKVKLIIIHLGDEDGCHGLIECGAIHVDGGPDGQHEANDASVDVVVFQEALKGDRQSGRAAAGKDQRK